MSKYVIRNCECEYRSDNFCWTHDTFCQDCTDCLLKRIVEDLKSKIHIYKDYDTDYARGKLKCAESILRLFDIQEVE